MEFLKIFSPIFLFIIIFAGSGIYFSHFNVEMAFYQIAPTVAIIPAIVLAFFLLKGPVQERMNGFIDGLRHRDIITMCLIFLFAGAFNIVTKSIGCVDATVNLVLSIMPIDFLLIGLFLTSSFISTAIGTSMGTIATVGPIAVGISNCGAIPLDLGIATVIGGAMFGDSLSPVGDTTIAAVLSQQADFKKKLILNAKVACIAAAFMIVILWWLCSPASVPHVGNYKLLLVIPYIALVIMALVGMNVFQVLISGLIIAGLIGAYESSYTFLNFAKDINKGFESMYDIFLLSLFVGGLANMMKKLGAMDYILNLVSYAHKLTKKSAQLLIGGLVSIFDILIANNCVAIIFSGEMAKTIAGKFKIPSHYTAAWLDIFSCVFQGILPYGAQVLLGSNIAGISPLIISSQVYYCYILGIVAVLYVLLAKTKN